MRERERRPFAYILSRLQPRSVQSNEYSSRPLRWYALVVARARAFGFVYVYIEVGGAYRSGGGGCLSGSAIVRYSRSWRLIMRSYI